MRYFVGIVGLIVLILAGSIFLALRRNEPSYQGKPVSVWLDEWATQKRTDYYTAIKEIGTNAIPYAVRRLARNDSAWRKKHRETWPKLPKFVQQVLPQPKRELDACDGANVFGDIGPVAIPQAIALLKHDSPTVRQAATWGLGALRRRFPEAKVAIPALIETLGDPERLVRFHAALALQNMGSDASNAVPALTKVVAYPGVGPETNNCFPLRACAAVALGKIGPIANSAIPTLMAALQTPNSYLRGQTAVAIWRITGDVDTTLPVLLQEMPVESEHSKWDWIIALGEMGPRARAAIPQLKEELGQDKEAWVLQYVTDALLKIDPEAAAKLGVFPPAPKE